MTFHVCMNFIVVKTYLFSIIEYLVPFLKMFLTDLDKIYYLLFAVYDHFLWMTFSVFLSTNQTILWHYFPLFLQVILHQLNLFADSRIF